MRTIAERLALAGQIQALWYPQWQSAWLKAVPIAPLIADEPATTPREIVEVFLGKLYNWTPEDSAYGTFNDCAWRPIDRAEQLRCVDEILRRARERVAEIAAEEATERAEAEAGGYLDALGPSRLDPEAVDPDVLRRWFTDELWGATGPTWFTNMAPTFDQEPAVIALDGDLLAILWLP